jgi:hypothetical protein
MSAVIKSFTSRLIASKPIFRVDGDKHDVRLVKAEKAVQDIDLNDDVGFLVISNLQETFNESTLKNVIDIDSIERQTFSSCLGGVRKFYENNCGLKKPRQSKAYGWLYHYSFSNAEDKLRDSIVLLYKYIQKIYRDTANDNKKEHVENVLNVIELLRSKYEGR